MAAGSVAGHVRSPLAAEHELIGRGKGLKQGGQQSSQNESNEPCVASIETGTLRFVCLMLHGRWSLCLMRAEV